MRKFLPLLLCLSLSIFTLARAMKPTHPLGSKSVRMSPMKQATDVNTFAKRANTEQETSPGNNDNTEQASGDEGDDANDDGGGDAAADDDNGDDNAADDDAGDDGGDNGGQ